LRHFLRAYKHSAQSIYVKRINNWDPEKEERWRPREGIGTSGGARQLRAKVRPSDGSIGAVRLAAASPTLSTPRALRALNTKDYSQTCETEKKRWHIFQCAGCGWRIVVEAALDQNSRPRCACHG